MVREGGGGEGEGKAEMLEEAGGRKRGVLRELKLTLCEVDGRPDELLGVLSDVHSSASQKGSTRERVRMGRGRRREGGAGRDGGGEGKSILNSSLVQPMLEKDVVPESSSELVTSLEERERHVF